MKRVLVTGAYGYIGGHLVTRLVEDGWSVNTLDTLENKKDWQFGTLEGANFYHSRASIVNSDAVSRALHRCSLMYHLAERKEYSLDPKAPARMFRVNAHGTTLLLSKARQMGLDNVVVGSTYEVYGNVVGAEEQGIAQPITTYGFSKMAGELVCRAFIALGMNIKILRIFSVWGGQFDNSDVARFMATDGVIKGSGTQTRDFVHISDVVRALRAASVWDAGIYNVGCGEEISITGLWNLLNPEVNAKHVEDAGEGSSLFRSVADLEYTRSETGWQPKIKLSELSRKQIMELLQ